MLLINKSLWSNGSLYVPFIAKLQLFPRKQMKWNFGILEQMSCISEF